MRIPEIDLPQAMIENDARQLARQANAQGEDAFIALPAGRRAAASRRDSCSPSSAARTTCAWIHAASARRWR